MKVTIDREGCISCGLCMSLCPEVFQFGEDDKAEVRRQPEREQQGAAQSAADGCPVSVIHTEE